MNSGGAQKTVLSLRVRWSRRSEEWRGEMRKTSSCQTVGGEPFQSSGTYTPKKAVAELTRD